MIIPVLEFIVKYFKNFNLTKAIGGGLLLLGLWFIGSVYFDNPDKTVLFITIGLLIAGIGSVIIYYDMANDDNGPGFDEGKLLNAAYSNKIKEEQKVSSWHIENKPDEPRSAEINKRK